MGEKLGTKRIPKRHVTLSGLDSTYGMQFGIEMPRENDRTSYESDSVILSKLSISAGDANCLTLSNKSRKDSSAKNNNN